MKLHLPTDLRNAVMACITALGGIAATGTTGTLAIGAAGVALASTALATEYTPNSANTISETLNSGDVINLSGNSIGTKDRAATLNFAANNSSVTLNATSGTCLWNVDSSSYSNNKGVSTVNVCADATLNVYAGNSYPAFNYRTLDLTINLKAGNAPEGTTPNGGILCSKGLIFGWSSETGAGARKLNMEDGSMWKIELNEYLNNTTVVMNHATIQLTNDKTLYFERFSNAIKTESTASGMSLITGGKLQLGGGSPQFTTIDGHEGYLFEIKRGRFDATNTADLRIESALQNGNTTNGLLKSGNGVLELTHANGDYTADVCVTAGTLKLGGANGQAGGGTITVDTANAANQAILELAHSGAATTTNRIDLDANAILKVTGSQEIIGVDSSLLGTVALSHTLLNTAVITVGETTIFDLTNWDIDKTGANPITLISGGTVSGYNLLNMENITGWGGATAEFSWDGTALTLATTSSTKVYWNSTSTTWGTDTTYKKGENNAAPPTNYDTIVFNTTPATPLSLGSDITNPVLITNDSTLQLTMGTYNLTGEVTVDSGSTLEIKDMTFTNNLFSKPLWDGDGTIILNSSAAANSNNRISLVNFNGTVQVSGNFNLASSEIGNHGTWHLKDGESLSSGNATIANEVVGVDNFTLRTDGIYTFEKKVTGESINIGHADTDTTVKFSNAASKISNVYVINGIVEYNGTDSGNGTLFTGDTHLAGNTSMTLTPGNANATTAEGARQYKGAVYVDGTVTVGENNQVIVAPATLTFTDGSINITEGLCLGKTSRISQVVNLVNSWDKNQFINGLYGTGDLFITCPDHVGSNKNARYIALTGSGDFTGALNIGSTMNSDDAQDYNFGMMVLGGASTALQNTTVNFDGTAAKKNALVFTTSTDVINKSDFTGTNFQSNSAADGALAGLAGAKGAVYAKVLTLGGNRECTYNGELFIKKLIVDRTGKQTLAGAANYRYNMEVDVQSGTLAFSGNADVTALTLTSNLEVNGGDVTIGSTDGSSGTLKATAGSVTLKEGTHVLGTLDLSNDSTATVTVQSGGSLQASTLRSSQNSSIALEDGATFIASDAVTIGGEASSTDADKSKVQATAAADYTIGSEQYTISNATVTVTANATTDTTIANKMLGSSLINNGNITVTTTNGGNDLTKIEANGGNINLQNVGAPEELHSLVIGAGKTVGAHTDASSVESVENEATLTVSEVAAFGQGATLNANLELKSRVVLTLDGALRMGSTLTLNGGMTLDGGLLAALKRLGVGETLDLFTGVDTLTLGDVSYTMGTDTLSKADGIDLNTYFSNVQAGSYVLGYNAVGTVYAESLVPEPATATLGLLALAGLCARRRRRQ